MVTPAEAFTLAAQSRRLSLKHIWHLYADDRCYYVHDAFLGESARGAYLQGLRIDGRTGAVRERSSGK